MSLPLLMPISACIQKYEWTKLGNLLAEIGRVCQHSPPTVTITLQVTWGYVADTSAVERMRRYRQRQRDEAERHAGKVALRKVFVTPAAHAMLAILGEQYGDVSGAVEEAIRRLHAAHYRAVTDDVTITNDPRTRDVTVTQPVTQKPPPRTREQAPGQAERRASIMRRVKELHASGMTASAIAAQLNREGEATLTGRGQWRHKLVQALISEPD